MNQEMKQVFEKLQRQGWTIERPKGKYWYVATPPDPIKPTVIMHHLPLDDREWANTIDRLRQSGADL